MTMVNKYLACNLVCMAGSLICSQTSILVLEAEIPDAIAMSMSHAFIGVQIMFLIKMIRHKS